MYRILNINFELLYILSLGYNGIIKKTITFRERLPFGQFVLTVLEMTADLSAEYRKNERVLADMPIIRMADWRLAAVWANDNSRLHIINNNEEMSYIVPSSKAIAEKWSLTEDNVARIENSQWDTFDQFVEYACGLFWNVTLSKDHWKTFSTCDCPYFLKHYMCKHVIGMSLRHKICKLPRAAIPTELGAKPKRGRKAQSTKALLTQ